MSKFCSFLPVLERPNEIACHLPNTKRYRSTRIRFQCVKECSHGVKTGPEAYHVLGIDQVVDVQDIRPPQFSAFVSFESILRIHWT